MDLFPRAFLLVFCQLAVGGLFCLSIPPFHAIERGYYKSSAFVYVLVAGLALVGRAVLWWDAEGGQLASRQFGETAAWTVFVAAAAGYLATLWGDCFRLRARLFTAAWMSGFVALVVFAESYRQAPALSVDTLLYPVTFVLSALVLGSAASGMLLGHWYLIDRDLSLTPLRHILALYGGALIAQAVVLAVGTMLLAASATGEPPVAARITAHLPLLAGRLGVSPLGATVLAVMIRRTLQIPQTMAATGLFYIAVLAVLVGELMGRYLLFRTGLPL